MKKLIGFFVFISLFFCFDVSCYAITIDENSPEKLAILFQNQLSVFPQEKIYLHTDKPCYIAGEKIWFRTHLVNAENHFPVYESQYIYVEMFNPADSLINRVKIRNNNGAYYGHIDIPENIPVGDYILRAYTNFMRNLDEHYICSKTIRIGNLYNSENLKEKAGQINNDRLLTNPQTDDEFDVTFYPEGGSLLQGVGCRVAFKALSSNGRPANVEGIIYDQDGNEQGKIKTEYMGMGSFIIFPEEGYSYNLLCTNEKNKMKRFELPAALKNCYALSVNNNSKNNIHVSVLKSASNDRHDTLYLMAHTRGAVYFSEQWDENRKFVTLPKKQLPSGVLHLILFDAYMNPLSERLLFINNDDQAKVSLNSDQKSFAARSLINNQITLNDSDGNPLSGSFSVSITADNAVSVDTTTNILTYLLLTSELKGNIENPAAYFTNDKSLELDMLMMTQGWRRYDVAAVAQGRLSYPEIPIEYSAEISGVVKGGFLLNKLSEKAQVSILSSDELCFDLLETDSEGHFSFRGCNFPDSTTFLVRAANKSNKTNVMLLIDEQNFPEWTLPKLASVDIEQGSFQKYVEKVKEQDEKNKEGLWMLNLPEVTIKGRHIPKSVFRPSYHIDEKRIRQAYPYNAMYELLDEIPRVRGGKYYTTANESTPINKLIIDDEINKPMEFRSALYEVLGLINIKNVKSIYFSIIHDGMPKMTDQFPPVTELVIICKNINDVFYRNNENNFKIINPLGYQKPMDFYAPKYDTPEARENTLYDPRTTIHWQPDLRTDSLGIASFEFYTADSNSSYTVVIEGITTEGKIVRHEEKLFINDEEIMIIN